MVSDHTDGLRVLHVLYRWSVSAGGPVTVTRSLLPELVSAGMRCAVATTTTPQEENDRVPLPGIPVHRFRASAVGKYWKGYSGALSAFLDAQLRNGAFDLVHVHEPWPYTSYAACRAAKRHAVPHLVTVHAEMLGPRLRDKRIRKWAYMHCVLNRQLRSADAVQALTQAEATAIRRAVKDAPVFVLPVGVNLGAVADRSGVRDFEDRHPALKDKKTILYLGRFHKMKGVEVLARSFARICGRHPDAVLLMAGPDHDGTKDQVEKAARRAGLSDRVVFTGTIDGPAKAAAFAAADVFVLPSYSEGFSSAVLEALAAGVPAVISENCSFPQVAERSAGFVVPVCEEAIAERIDTLLSDGELRKAMGKKGKALVREYSWPSLAARMADRYLAVVDKHRTAS